MVQSIRTVEQANRTETRIEIEAEEARFKNAIRYRAILKHDIVKGHELSPDDVYFLRHPSGVDAVALSQILEQRVVATKDLSKDSLLQMDDLMLQAEPQPERPRC